MIPLNALAVGGILLSATFDSLCGAEYAASATLALGVPGAAKADGADVRPGGGEQQCCDGGGDRRACHHADCWR